jgi:phosphoribosylformimino-5-aminoimidazole carboxamide ribotide isomerase
MKFRPCIDLHSGQVKQIVGSTLIDIKKEETANDDTNLATNFETDRPAGESSLVS